MDDKLHTSATDLHNEVLKFALSYETAALPELRAYVRSKFCGDMKSILFRISELPVDVSTHSSEPGPSATSFNISQLRAIYTCTELLWECEFRHGVTQELGQCITDNSAYPKTLLIDEEVMVNIRQQLQPLLASEIQFEFIHLFAELIQNNSFSGMMINRNLIRLVGILIVYIRETSKVSNNPDNCREAKSLLYEIVQKQGSFCISELRRLSSGPVYARNMCSKIVTTVLLCKLPCSCSKLKGHDLYVHLNCCSCWWNHLTNPFHNNGSWVDNIPLYEAFSYTSGLELVLAAYVDKDVTSGPGDHGSFASNVHELIVKLLTSIPKSMAQNKDAYWYKLVPQILNFFQIAVLRQNEVMVKICVMLVGRVVALSADWGMRILSMIMYPIETITGNVKHDCEEESTGTGMEGVDSISVNSVNKCMKNIGKQLWTRKNDFNDCTVGGGTGLVASEMSVELCVKILWSIIHICPVSPTMATCLRTSGVGENMLYLSTFLLTHAKSCNLNTRVQEFCLSYFNNAASIELVCEEIDKVIFFHHEDHGAECVFRLGATGGLEKYGVHSTDSTQVSEGNAKEVLLPSTDARPSIHPVGHGEKDTDASALMAMISLLTTHTGDMKELQDRNIQDQFLATGKRAEAVAGLLTLCTGDENSTSPMHLKCKKIASSFFLTVLKRFLLPHMSSHGGKSSMSMPGENDTDKALVGLVLITLKDYIAVSTLFVDGMKIIEVVDIFLKAFVSTIEKKAGEDRYLCPVLGGEGDAADPATSGKPGPLITEVEEEPSDTEVSNMDEEDEAAEVLDTVLSLLGMILGLGNKVRPVEEEALLKSLMSPLHDISQYALRTNQATLSQTAADLILMILVRSTPEAEASSAKQATAGSTAGGGTRLIIEESDETTRGLPVPPVLTPIQKVLSEDESYRSSTDPSLRGLAVRNLIVILRETVQRPPLSDITDVLEVLVEAVMDTDSFVYLNALHGLGRLADLHRAFVFQSLLRCFESASSNDSGTSNGTTDVNPTSTASRGLASPCSTSRSNILNAPAEPVFTTIRSWRPSVRNQIVLSEAVTLILRRSGELGPKYSPGVVRICVLMSKTLTRSRAGRLGQTTHLRPCNAPTVNLLTMKISRPVVEEESVDNEEANHYTASLVEESEKSILRQCILSLLAEALVMAGWTANQYLADIVDICTSILLLETDTELQVTRAARRAAIFCIKHILTGLKDKIFSLASDSSSQNRSGKNTLSIIYNTLKQVSDNHFKDDKVVIFHATNALVFLNDLIRSQLFASDMESAGMPAINAHVREPLIRML